MVVLMAVAAASQTRRFQQRNSSSETSFFAPTVKLRPLHTPSSRAAPCLLSDGCGCSSPPAAGGWGPESRTSGWVVVFTAANQTPHLRANYLPVHVRQAGAESGPPDWRFDVGLY